MKSIIFIAPPAAGKGTLSKMLEDKYNLVHISTGDLLRDAIKQDTEYKDLITNIMSKGELISDEIILELLKRRLSNNDCDNGYILDGFPRTVSQAISYNEMLKDLNKELGYVIVLDVDKELAKSRILNRLTCHTCGSVYNSLISDTKPIKENTCDKCHTNLIKREDDNIETYENRYNTYLEKTKPLIDFYQNLNVLYHVDSTNKVKTFNEVIKILGCNND